MKTRFSTYLLTLCASLYLLFSCTLEHTGDPKTDVRFVPYRVTVNSGQTKASLNGQTQYVFAEGDRLFVNYIVGNDVKMHGFMTLISGAGNTTAEFQGDLACEDEFTPESTTPINVTLFSASDAIHSISNNKVGTIYPTNQFAGTFADAVAKFSDFTATSTFGATSLSLNQQSSFLIFNIRMKAVDEAPVARVITAKLYGDGNLEGIPLRSVEIPVSEAGSVPFVLAFKGGDVSLANAILRLEWKNAENEDQSKEFTVSDQTLAANNYYTVSRTTIGFDGFRIRAKYDNTSFTFKYTNGSVEFSEDSGENWHTYDGRTFTLDADEQVCFRGNRANCDCNGTTQLFSADNVCYIAGKITSLLADKNSLAANAFRSAFSNGDSNNTNPAPVTFVDIDPTDPLILPAFTATNCYREMFRACTSLTSVPDLPATEVAPQCYFNMFRKCTGLTTANIELPATTLSEDCYRELFRECSNLTSVPIFPAATLVARCYQQMLSGCWSLRTVKCLATNISATDCTKNWLSDVTNTNECTFFRDPNMTSWTRNQHGIPSNWQVFDYTE